MYGPAMILAIRRARAVVSLLAFALGIGVLVAPTAPAQAATDIRSVRILSGEMHYVTDVTSTSSSGPDGAGNWSTSKTHYGEDVVFAVGTPGTATSADTGESAIEAPLTVTSWNHSFTSRFDRNYLGCGSSRTESDSGLIALPAPGVYSASLGVTLGGGLQDVDAQLAPSHPTEPRFGWVAPAGLAWASSEVPSAVWTAVSTSECEGDSSQTLTSYLYGPFEPAAFNAKVESIGTPSKEVLSCSPTTCKLRISSTHAFSYVTNPDPAEAHVSGGTTITWSFVVEVSTESGSCHTYNADYEARLASSVGAPMVQYALDDVAYCQDGSKVIISSPGQRKVDMVYSPAVATVMEELGLKFKYKDVGNVSVSNYANGGALLTAYGDFDFCAQIPIAGGTGLKLGVTKALKVIKMSKVLRKALKILPVKKIMKGGLVPKSLKRKIISFAVAAVLKIASLGSRDQSALRELVDNVVDTAFDKGGGAILGLITDGICIHHVWTPKIEVSIPREGVPTSSIGGVTGIFSVHPYQPTA